MNDFTNWKTVSSDAKISLTVLESSEERNILVKQYQCSSYEEGDCLLKEALVQAANPYPLWMVLRKISLCDEKGSVHTFTFNFVYEKLLGDGIPRKVIEKNDRFERTPGIKGYKQMKLIYEKIDKIPPVQVYEAYNSEQKAVAIKLLGKFRRASLCNGALKEAFIQASIWHTNSTSIIDIGMIHAEGGFKIALVLEKFERDLGKDIKEREGQRYTEEELLSFLRQISSVLLYAKRKGIAHRDIKPDNIFITGERVFKLGDFGSAWTTNKPIKDAGKRASQHSAKQSLDQYETQKADGTPFYLSPEMRSFILGSGDYIDSFASDVYSLGVTTLEMATLEIQASLNTADTTSIEEAAQRTIASLMYSDSLTTLLMKMLKIDYKQRPDMFDINKLELYTKDEINFSYEEKEKLLPNKKI